MKKFRKLVHVGTIIFALLAGICTMMPAKVHAASFSAYASSSTVYVGDTFTIYIGGNVVGRFDVSASNASLSAASVFIDNIGGSAAISCRPAAIGTVQVSVTAVDVSTADYKPVGGTQYISVNVIARPTGGGGSTHQPPASNQNTSNDPQKPSDDDQEDEAKSDLSLKALSFSVGKLSPSFSGDTMDYVLKQIPRKTKSINVSGEASKPDDVFIEGLGSHKINADTKTIKVITKDKEGNQRVYTITLEQAETPKKYVDTSLYGKLGILTNYGEAAPLKGFKDTSVKIAGEEYAGKKQEKGDLVLLYMLDKKEHKNYYIFDEGQRRIVSVYVPITICGFDLAVVHVPDEVKEQSAWSAGTIKIDGVKRDGFRFKDKSLDNYFLLYLMDDKGNEHLYQYDKTMNTLQMYANQAPLSLSAYNQSMHDKTMLIYTFIAATVIFAVLSAVLGYLLITLRRDGARYEK